MTERDRQDRMRACEIAAIALSGRVVALDDAVVITAIAEKIFQYTIDGPSEGDSDE